MFGFSAGLCSSTVARTLWLLVCGDRWVALLVDVELSWWPLESLAAWFVRCGDEETYFWYMFVALEAKLLSV